MAEFSGLRSSGCVTLGKNGREASFLDAVAAQLTPKVSAIILLLLSVSLVFLSIVYFDRAQACLYGFWAIDDNQ